MALAAHKAFMSWRRRWLMLSLGPRGVCATNASFPFYENVCIHFAAFRWRAKPN